MLGNTITRRSFLVTLPAAAGFARNAFAAMSDIQRAFIGTTGKDSKGIFVADFDPKTGSFSTPKPAASVLNTDFMTLSPKNRNRMYTTCLVDGVSAVTAFEVTTDASTPLKQLSQQTAKGTSAVYVSLDATGRVVMEANWGSGSINTYQVLADGSTGPAVEHIEYGDTDHGPTQPQQVHSRAHSIVTSPDNKYVLVNDYGTDRINIYALDPATAKLTPGTPAFWKSAPGTAPRHVVWHPNGRWLYSNNELSNTVDLLLWDAKKATLQLKQTWSTLPADAPPKCRTADLMLSPDAKFLYGSNRGLESFVVWSIAKDGTLKQIQLLKQSGAENRQITIDATGRWFLGANVRSGDVVVFPRDPKTGMLGEQVSSCKLTGACFTLWG